MGQNSRDRLLLGRKGKGLLKKIEKKRGGPGGPEKAMEDRR